jgi:CheY-like chemotaxis protein
VLLTDEDTVSVGPAGSLVLAAPMARVVAPDPVVEVAPQLVEYAARMKELVAELAKDPSDEPARAELADVTERLAERSAIISGHPVARFLSGLEGLARDVAQREGPLDASVRATLEDSVRLLDKVLAPEVLNRAKALPAPKILAVDSDDYLLPAIVAALDFARFQTTGCNEAEKALGLVKEESYDTVLLGMSLPGATPQDACAGLRALPNGGKVPVISMPSHGAPRPEGVNDSLAKPVNMFELTLKTNLWVLKRQLNML